MIRIFKNLEEYRTAAPSLEPNTDLVILEGANSRFDRSSIFTFFKDWDDTWKECPYGHRGEHDYCCER